MQDTSIIDLTPENIANYGVCGYKDARKHVEVQKKIAWFREYYPKGLRTKIIFSESFGYQGMIEYLPGEYAHRPVEAVGYMFIHCIFVGFRKEFKGRGHALTLLDACIGEARESGKLGVAVVTRKGSFMANSDIFIKRGFEVADNAKPDFSLLALKFNPTAGNPRFRTDMNSRLESFPPGLTVLRSAQCPYTEKNVNAILDTARDKFNLAPRLVELDSAAAAQDSPCPFGTFGIIYAGEVISHHPISNTRFENIMKKLTR